MPPREAFERALEAMQAIGRVTESGQTTKTVVGTTRYGLQRVKLRVSVLPRDGGSVIQIGGAGDDVWGAAARRATDKLIQALA